MCVCVCVCVCLLAFKGPVDKSWCLGWLRDTACRVLGSEVRTQDLRLWSVPLLLCRVFWGFWGFCFFGFFWVFWGFWGLGVGLEDLVFKLGLRTWSLRHHYGFLRWS